MDGFGRHDAGRPMTVLLVEDDPADTLLITEAFQANAPTVTLIAISDGLDALRYLRRQDEYARSRRPDLVLLDLDMPRKDGREVLAELKADEALRLIPVVILTTSEADEDVSRSYEKHANAYVTKPTDPDDFARVIVSIQRFFAQVARLPPRD